MVGGLNLPVMQSLGLGCITSIAGVDSVLHPLAHYGKMREASAGKDTITGHWEMAGVIQRIPFPTFPTGFPFELVTAIESAIGTPVIGNIASSGTDIIKKLGKDHVLSGYPIVYTSADSVFQIAMHEEIIQIDKQYDICASARGVLTGEWQMGRVICRPFAGDGNDSEVRKKLVAISASFATGPFTRTEKRKDYPVTPPRTVLNDLITQGRSVHAIGKIAEIFNGSGVSSFDHTTNNVDHIAALRHAIRTNQSDFIFANLEDFDMLYGHRNDAHGMARALEAWDFELGKLLHELQPGDLLMITADHGNDPTTPSTDHSREYPFLLVFDPTNNEGKLLGIRKTFADVAATIRDIFDCEPTTDATSFLPLLS